MDYEDANELILLLQCFFASNLALLKTVQNNAVVLKLTKMANPYANLQAVVECHIFISSQKQTSTTLL